MNEDLDAREARRRASLGEPVIDPLIDAPIVDRGDTGTGFLLPAILGLFILFGVLFYYHPWTDHAVNTASNAVNTATEKVVPPTELPKPAQPTQTQPPQPQ